ncbi:MAG: hypothetical protein HYY06_24285 [Deltaproteobacteria bacterium]|nr:hypothetical protein [Deltaproteobacteria bacterium]
MGLRGALAHDELRALDGKWVRLVVGAFEWSIEEVDRAEADEWWEAHRPASVQVPFLDLSVTELTDATRILDPELGQDERIRAAIPAFGGKASHYAELSAVEGIDVPEAFAIPVYFYDQFMRQNGLYDRVRELLRNEEFVDDARTRSERLAELGDAMKRAPVDEGLARALEDLIERDFGSTRMRFRSSTNAEDLEGFTGAGLYTSRSGALGDPERPVLDAVREVWSSVWSFRAFEERSYRGISHENVGMAILVHRSFPDELANGVALTANPFDVSGLEPGFYVNVQRGEASVVQPEPGTATDQFVYQFDRPNRPIIYYGHSSEIPEGETVLTTAQTYALGQALDAIHRHFRESYGPPPDQPNAWYAMDVEFKLDVGRDGEPAIVIKQARPHPGRGR